MHRLLPLSLLILPACTSQPTASQPTPPTPTPAPTAPAELSASSLGNFSVSLAVKNLATSREFYEKLGFRSVGGDAKTWIILQNGPATVGLFHGMFDKNMLTFNPGWNSAKQPLATFQDVRDLQKLLESRGLKLTQRADDASTGPAYIMLTDPDGNPILIDQHVPRPPK